MRSHDNEHGDSLPKVEITSLRHVAYILDAFIYYLRSNQMTESLPSSVDNPKKKSLTKLEQMKENTVEKRYECFNNRNILFNSYSNS